MIADVIVMATLLFAGCYALLWSLRKDWRARIEAPKLIFQQQLRAYDAGNSPCAKAPGKDFTHDADLHDPEAGA